MIGMITPLVKGAKHPRIWFRPIIAYSAGALLSAALVGMVLGFVGRVSLQDPWRPIGLGVVGILGLALTAADLGIGGRDTPTLRRQTCSRWWRTHGHVRAMFLWGIDLGLGFTTIRLASLYWIVTLVVIVLGSPLLGALILGLYGLALSGNLVIGMQWLERWFGDGASASVRAVQLGPVFKPALALLTLLWSAFLLVVLLAKV